MSDKIKEIIEEIEAMKVKLEEEISQQEKDITYEIQNGYVRFEKEVLSSFPITNGERRKYVQYQEKAERRVEQQRLF